MVKANLPDTGGSAWLRLRLPRSLVHLLLTILLLLSILPTMGVGVTICLVGQRQRLTLLQDQFNSVLTLKEQQITLWVTGRERDLALLAGEPALLESLRQVLLASAQGEQQPEAASGVRARLAAVQNENDQFLDLMLLDNSGVILLSSRTDYEGMAHSQHSYFREGLVGPFVQPPAFDVSLALDAPSMVVSRPVLAEDGRPLGVLAGIVNLTALDQIIQESAGLGETGTTYMINKSGFLISAGRVEGGYSYQQRVLTEGVDRALSGQTGFATYENLTGRPVIGAYTWLPALESALLVEQEEQEAFAALKTIVVPIVTAVFVIVVFMTIASVWLARWITRPLVRLTETAQAIAAGDLAQTASIERSDEVGTLARAFNSMTRQLRELVGGLEQRVVERTAELTQANRELEREIAERKRAETELWRLKDFNEGIVQSMTEGIVVEDAEGYFTFVNPAAAILLGYSPAELVGQLWTVIVHPDHQPSVEAANERRLCGESDRYEINVVHKDGRRIPILISGSPRFDAQGRFLGTLAVFADISERVRAEMEREKLLTTERQQRLLAETLTGVTLALTSQTSHAVVLGEIVTQAQRLVPARAASIVLLEDDSIRIARRQGYTESADRAPISSLSQPMEIFPLDKEVIQTRRPLIIHDTHREPRWVTVDEGQWVRSHLAVPICLRDQVIGLLRLASDSTGAFSAEDAQRLQPLANAAAIAIENAQLVEGLEAEVASRTAEIRAEQEKSEAILRSVSDAIIMTDMERRILYVNSAFTALTGYTTEEVVGQYPNFMMAGRMLEQKWRSLVAALDESRAWQGEVTLRRKDGRSYEAALTIAPVQDVEGQLVGYVSSHKDISQRKELEQARSRFMTLISHELRTPVTNIQLYAYLLRQGKPEKVERYTQVLEEQAGRLAHLIRDILEMTALDSGQAAQTWEPLAISTMVGDTITRYQSQARVAGLSLTLHPISPDLPPVQGDPARLAQALGQVVENAIVFTPESAPAGGQVSIRVEGVEEGGQRWLTIAVQDDGPGISPAEQERVFDRFFRGKLAESGHVPGTGLGLSMAQETLRAHGGRVTVESDGVPGQGSTFTLWLRIASGGQ